MTGPSIVAILLAVVAVVSLLLGGVGALSGVLIVAAIAAGIYLFRNTRSV